LAEWQLIERDLHQVYGIDVHEALDTRSWRWLSSRIVGLLETECRISHFFAPPELQPKTKAT